MLNLMTTGEIRKKYTEEDIKKIFDKNNIYAKKETEKSCKNYGMISVFNKINALYYFNSYAAAYHYFLKNNWI
tara:strand:+ start:212 stop:430 length:219 start_codon:yes stop_codon:yes gene_type:complete